MVDYLIEKSNLKMKVSIITPAFNPGKLILETFISLQNQTFQYFEWIIIDDCCDDFNKALFQKIKNDASFSVLIISNPKNYKQSKSKNIGLKHANGRYVKFLDADDLIDVYHLENQYNSIRKLTHKKFAIFSPTLNFWQSDIGERKELLNTSYKKVKNNNFDQLKQFIVFPFFHHCGCLFLKQDILEIGGFDEHLVTDEDGDFILRLMFNDILFISQDKSKYLYRHHNNRRVSENDSIEKWDSRYHVCEKIEKQLIDRYSLLKEQLAQRLDVLSVQALNQDNDIYIKFLNTANRVYPNYKLPGTFVQNLVRRVFGLKSMLLLKSILK